MKLNISLGVILAIWFAYLVVYRTAKEELEFVDSNFKVSGEVPADAHDMMVHSLKKAGIIVIPYIGKKVSVSVTQSQCNSSDCSADIPSSLASSKVIVSISSNRTGGSAEEYIVPGQPDKTRLQEVMDSAARMYADIRKKQDKFVLFPPGCCPK